MGRVIFHIDLNAFFANAEILLNPSLANKPIAVAGSTRRSVVSTCSYEARAYGIHSAMSIQEAKKRCKDLIIVQSHHEYYEEQERNYKEKKEKDPFRKFYKYSLDENDKLLIIVNITSKTRQLDTKEYGIKTIVSLNPIMIDGTGMCGGCRVTVGGQVKFACVDGPDFDAHQVDFDELTIRNRMYHNQEKHDMEHMCRLFGGAENV